MKRKFCIALATGLAINNVPVSTEASNMKKGDIDKPLEDEMTSIKDTRNLNKGVELIHSNNVNLMSIDGDISTMSTVEEFTSSDGFTFTVDNDSNATITGYTGSDTSITIPITISSAAKTDYNVTSIANQAFRDNTSITSVTIQSNITEIPTNSFNGCTNLTSVSLHSSVTSIGNYAFANCSSLSTVSSTQSIKSIGTGAFSNCTNLDALALSANLTSVDSTAFSNCPSLKITFSGTTAEWENIYSGTLTSGASIDCTEDSDVVTHNSFSYTLHGNTATAIGYTGSSTSITVPSTMTYSGRTYNVTHISPEFSSSGVSNASSITSVQFSEGITHIERDALYGFSQLATLRLPNSLQEIGANLLSSTNSTALRDIYYNGSRNEWENVIFHETVDALVSRFNIRMYFDNNNHSQSYVGDFSYSISSNNRVTITGYTGRSTNISIPSTIDGRTVTNIGDNAFRYKSIESVTIPNTVTSIGSRAFANCDNLIRVYIPNSVTYISSNAFNTGGYIDGSLINIFYRGSSYEWSRISNHGDIEDDYVINFNSSSLPNVPSKYIYTTSSGFQYYEDYNTVIVTGYTGRDTVVTIPSRINGKTVIEVDSTFPSNNRSITEIIFSEGIQRIDENVFASSRDNHTLETIHLPSTIKQIGDNSFLTYNLDVVYYNGSEDDWNEVINLSNITDDYLEFSDGSTTSGNATSGSLNFYGANTNNLTVQEEEYKTITTITHDDGTVVQTTTNTKDGALIEAIELVKPDGTEILSNIRDDDKVVVTLTIPPTILASTTKTDVIIPTGNVNLTNTTVVFETNSNGLIKVLPTSLAVDSGMQVTVDKMENLLLVQDNKKSFADVNITDWFLSDIDFVSSRELLIGTSSTKFSPDLDTNKAMAVSLLYRYDGASVQSGGGEWYSDAALWSSTTGISDAQNLEENITREELVTMLYNYAKKEAGATAPTTDTVSNFTDAFSVSANSKEAMNWAFENGILFGKSTTTIDPQGFTTRAEVAAMFSRFIQN